MQDVSGAMTNQLRREPFSKIIVACRGYNDEMTFVARNVRSEARKRLSIVLISLHVIIAKGRSPYSLSILNSIAYLYREKSLTKSTF